jgi:hypothetical protein
MSPTAHKRSPTRSRESTGMPCPSACTPTVSKPKLSTRGHLLVGVDDKEGVPAAEGGVSEPGRAAAVSAWSSAFVPSAAQPGFVAGQPTRDHLCRLTAVQCSIRHEIKIETVPQRVARAAIQLDETGVNGSSFHAQTGQIRQDERGSRPVQIPPRARQRLAPGPGPGASFVAGQRTSPVAHPRCSVVAVAAACSSSSTSGARLSHLSHVVCVGRSTRRSEV